MSFFLNGFGDSGQPTSRAFDLHPSMRNLKIFDLLLRKYSHTELSNFKISHIPRRILSVVTKNLELGFNFTPSCRICRSCLKSTHTLELEKWKYSKPEKNFNSDAGMTSKEDGKVPPFHNVAGVGKFVKNFFCNSNAKSCEFFSHYFKISFLQSVFETFPFRCLLNFWFRSGKFFSQFSGLLKLEYLGSDLPDDLYR